MKQFRLSAILMVMHILIGNQFCTGQVILDTLYYDQNWLLSPKLYAKYYRIATIDTANKSFTGGIIDFYSDGRIQMTGKYSNHIRTDTFTIFHPNGNIESKGIYSRNKRDGVWQYYHSNGRIKLIVEFIKDNFKILHMYDSLGLDLLPNGNGTWEYTYDLNTLTKIRVTGNITKYEKTGIWKVFDSNFGRQERLSREVLFAKNKPKSSLGVGTIENVFFYDAESPKLYTTELFGHSDFVTRRDYQYLKNLPTEIDSTKLQYHKNAAFPGGPENFTLFLLEKIKYPDDAKRNNVCDLILLEFTVSTLGQIKNVKSNSLNLSKDKRYNNLDFAMACYDGIIKSPNWTPASMNGIKVEQKLSLLIKFGDAIVESSIEALIARGLVNAIKIE